jgi:hypothetical protein
MKPSIALSNPHEQCLTFYWDKAPSFHVGYRFVEGQPRLSDQPLAGYARQPVAQDIDPPRLEGRATSGPSNPNWKKEWQVAYTEANPHDPVQLSFRVDNNGVAHAHYVENDGLQQHELILQPFSHGVRIWLKLTTRQAIPGSYCLQQCLRFTGMYNDEWRQVIAHTPFLSELDMQAMGNANGTLTYARRDDQWFGFPVQHVVYPTLGNIEKASEPHSDRVDHGLIVRETPSRDLAPDWYWERVAPGATWCQITSGVYWERTAYVSNRQPADCVHAWVDFGPLAAGQSRTLQGAVYFIEGSKDDLLELWGRDFTVGG